MRAASGERSYEGLCNTRRVHGARLHQQHQVDEVTCSAIRRSLAWESVGVDLRSELLFGLDDQSGRRRDARETQPVAPVESVDGIDNDISDSNIQMELDESPSCHDGLDGITRSVIRRAFEFRCRLAHTEGEPVTGICRANIL